MQCTDCGYKTKLVWWTPEIPDTPLRPDQVAIPDHMETHIKFWRCPCGSEWLATGQRHEKAPGD